MRLLITAFFIFFLGAAVFFISRPATKEIINPVAQPAPAPASKPSPAPKPEAPKPKPAVRLPLDVPFTVQAPFAEWSDPRQEDACEEASALMAVKWARGEKIESREAARTEILAIVAWQQEKHGDYHDTSATDTLKRLIYDYYQYPKATLKPVREAADIVFELERGNLVITPMNGQALNNPHFTQPGPQRHMIVIKGFDKDTLEFITNDPGISQGESYRYPQDVFFAAIRDYPTGYRVPITTVEKNMIVVTK